MREPAYYADYPSKMCSKYYCWTKDMGYPELDVRQFPDGSWQLIQYLNTPIIPSLTRFQPVLMGIRNVEISPSFIKHHADRLNLEKGAVWAEQKKSEQKAMDDVAYEERRAIDFSENMMKGLKRSPALLERIRRNGLKELDLRRQVQYLDVRDLPENQRRDIKRI